MGILGNYSKMEVMEIKFENENFGKLKVLKYKLKKRVLKT